MTPVRVVTPARSSRVLGDEGAALAAFLPPRPEHEVLHQQLAAAFELCVDMLIPAGSRCSCLMPIADPEVVGRGLALDLRNGCLDSNSVNDVNHVLLRSVLISEKRSYGTGACGLSLLVLRIIASSLRRAWIGAARPIYSIGSAAVSNKIVVNPASGGDHGIHDGRLSIAFSRRACYSLGAGASDRSEKGLHLCKPLMDWRAGWDESGH